MSDETKNGELSEDELDNVTGGARRQGGIGRRGAPSAGARCGIPFQVDDSAAPTSSAGARCGIPFQVDE